MAARQWVCKRQFNNVVNPVYEWYYIRKYGDYARGYAIRPQYKVDGAGKDTDEMELYLAIEYGQCIHKNKNEYYDETWKNMEIGGDRMLIRPRLIRVCFSFSGAESIIEKRIKYVDDQIGKYFPQDKNELYRAIDNLEDFGL